MSSHALPHHGARTYCTLIPPLLGCRIAHLQLTGHMRFLPSGAAGTPGTGGSASPAAASPTASPVPRKWHNGKVEAYISAQPPSLVCSATISLGPLSWVKGFVSLPAQGTGGAWQWKLCSMMRMQDLGGAAGTPAGLDQSALAAHLAREAGGGGAAFIGRACLQQLPVHHSRRRLLTGRRAERLLLLAHTVPCSGAAVPASAAPQPGAALAASQRHLRC